MPIPSSSPANDVFSPEFRQRFGNPKPEVTHWGIEGAVGENKWRKLRVSNGEGVAEGEWPIETLAIDVVRERWGPGTYRARFFVFAGGQSSIAGTGRPFVVEQIREDEPEPPAAVGPLMPSIPGFQDAMMMMGYINQQSDSKVENLIRTAAAFGGGNRGMDPAMLQLMMQNQAQQQTLAQTQFQAALDASRTASEHQLTLMRHELAALRGQLAREDEDDGVAEKVVRAAGPLFRPGKPIGEGMKAAIANYAVENPKEVLDVIKAIPGIIAAVAAMTKPTEPAPPPVQLPRELPRAIAKAVVKEAPPRSGINEILARKAEEEKKAKPEPEKVQAPAAE